MPKLPGPAAVAAAVALVLLCVSGFDALSVVREVRDGGRDVAAAAAGIEAAGELETALVGAARDGLVPARPSPAVRRALGDLAAAERGDGDGDRERVPADVMEVERQLAARTPSRAVPLEAVLLPLARYVEAETHEQEAFREEAEQLTARAMKGDGLGMLAAVALGFCAWVAVRRRAPAPAPAAVAAPATALAPQQARTGPSSPPPPQSAAVPAPKPAPEPMDATRFLEADPDEDGPGAGEVAEAVNRVRRDVMARYTRAEADRGELAGIVDTAFDAFVAVDAEGRITRWNSRAVQLFGWSDEEAIGRPVLGTALGPPAGSGPLSAGDLHALAAARPDEPAELVAWHRSGRSFPVEVALSVGGTGDDGAVYAFVRDISRRRRSERRQQAVHAMTRALAEADTLDEGSESVVRVLGEAYEWTAGTTWVRDERTGRLRALRAWTDGSPRLGGWHEACAQATLQVGEGLPGEAWLTGGLAYREDAATTADDPRAGAATAAGLRSSVCLPLLLEGQVAGVVELLAGAPRSVERWLLDDFAALQQVLASFLERRRARAASARAQREFLTLVSHELRTPLTSIMGYVQMLGARMDGAGDAERRCVDIIGRNADRLHRLVGDLLFAAEISHGNLRLESGAVCMQAVVRDAADAAQPAADTRAVQVTIDAEPVGAVEGDAGRLSQVLDNLLSNAIKFSHEGGAVTVRLRQAGDHVEVAVRDDGIGVAADDVARLTTQFFRAGTAQSAQVPGMGLGLSLSKAIVEAHGGELRFDSAEDEGTTVTVRLPAAPAAPAALAA